MQFFKYTFATIAYGLFDNVDFSTLCKIDEVCYGIISKYQPIIYMTGMGAYSLEDNSFVASSSLRFYSGVTSYEIVELFDRLIVTYAEYSSYI